MTYIQITSRCNMTCEHCAMACGKKGEDMTKATWKKSMEFAENYDSCIAIGGGEPTMHKHFREFLLDAISIDSEMHAFIATNGSIKKHALLLAKLAKAGIIMAALSQDPWHDPISDEVIQAFTKDSFYGSDDEDYREIRDVSNGVKNKGRAIDEGVGMVDGCACLGWFVAPNGDIKLCGCIDAPVIANVHDVDLDAKMQAMFEVEGIGSECHEDLQEALEEALCSC